MKQTTLFQNSFKRVLDNQADEKAVLKRQKTTHDDGNDDDIVIGNKEDFDDAKFEKEGGNNTKSKSESGKRRKLPWAQEISKPSLPNPDFDLSQNREKLDYQKSNKSRSSNDKKSFYEYSKGHRKVTKNQHSETTSATSKSDTEDYSKFIESTGDSVENLDDDQVFMLLENGYIEETSSDEFEESDLQNKDTAISQSEKGYVVAFPRSQYPMPDLTKNSLFIICYIHEFLIQMSKQSNGAFRHMGSFIREVGIEVAHMIIVRSIPTVVYEIFDNSMQWTIQQLLEVIKTPYDNSSGVYMDVMTDSEALDWFRLYVGSACSDVTKGLAQKGLRGRISQHLSSAYRETKGGLHYTVLDSLKTRKSSYGTLAKFPGIWGDDALPWTRMTEQIFGNLFSVLQTPDFRLSGILDVSNSSLRGKGLNVALVHFQKAANRRQTGSSFQDLKHSEDPVKRKYYWDAVARGSKKSTTNRNKIIRDNANTSGLLKVKVFSIGNRSPRGQMFIHGVPLSISTDQVRIYGIKNDDMVNVTYDQVPTGRHPNIFATASLPEDPANKLGIKIGSQDASGKQWSTWLKTSGEAMVLKTNTIIDFLNGVPQEESNNLPRRYTRGTRKSATKYS